MKPSKLSVLFLGGALALTACTAAIPGFDDEDGDYDSSASYSFGMDDDGENGSVRRTSSRMGGGTFTSAAFTSARTSAAFTSAATSAMTSAATSAGGTTTSAGGAASSF